MQSENNTGAQGTPKRSFIEQARRSQIVAAAIETLADVGYGKASLAQIAKRAQISPSLIPYHFTDKDALIYQTLSDIADAWHAYVQAQVAPEETAGAQLRSYIEASLAYMGTRPSHYAALIEIVFNARTPDGVLLYRIDDEEDPNRVLLKTVLAHGQETGEFRAFDVHLMALAIEGAISQFFGEMHKAGANLEAYTAEMIDLFARAVAQG
ncbi:MAG TPA: TetR/AcrR family transcriptional regulator [Roseiflexaceae bacterium]|nr:TetR/AcrR family transcriptional regulator [Roseiflexaceae bacterium]